MVSCRVASTTGLVALTAVLWSRPAYAYIDWGTASMLFQALTGRMPFAGESAHEVLAGHLFGEVPRLSDAKAGSDWPDALEVLVSELLAKEPGARPADAAEVRRRLEVALEWSDWEATVAETPGVVEACLSETTDAVPVADMPLPAGGQVVLADERRVENVSESSALVGVLADSAETVIQPVGSAGRKTGGKTWLLAAAGLAAILLVAGGVRYLDLLSFSASDPADAGLVGAAATSIPAAQRAPALEVGGRQEATDQDAGPASSDAPDAGKQLRERMDSEPRRSSAGRIRRTAVPRRAAKSHRLVRKRVRRLAKRRSRARRRRKRTARRLRSRKARRRIVTLLIVSKPPGAAVVVGGKTVGKTPYSMRRRAGSGEVVWKLTMPGYLSSKKRRWRTARDQRARVVLVEELF